MLIQLDSSGFTILCSKMGIELILMQVLLHFSIQIRIVKCHLILLI